MIIAVLQNASNQDLAFLREIVWQLKTFASILLEVHNKKEHKKQQQFINVNFSSLSTSVDLAQV